MANVLAGKPIFPSAAIAVIRSRFSGLSGGVGGRRRCLRLLGDGRAGIALYKYGATKRDSGMIALRPSLIISINPGMAGVAASVRFPSASATPLLTRGSGSSIALNNAGTIFCSVSLSC